MVRRSLQARLACLEHQQQAKKPLPCYKPVQIVDTLGMVPADVDQAIAAAVEGTNPAAHVRVVVIHHGQQEAR
jgi:hypothetical protein